MSTISIIAAVAEDNAIGKNQELLWRMPADMKRFKELTTGHTVIMGRKTFESLPNGGLPNRKNVVLTSMPEANFIGCFACESINEALELCEKEEQIFLIGGSLVYKLGLDFADKMYLTRVTQTFRMQMPSSRMSTGRNGKRSNVRNSRQTKRIRMPIHF